MSTSLKMRDFKNHYYPKKKKRVTHPCYLCDKQLNRDKVTVDHFIPLSKGGEDEWHNMRICCERCNKNKADKLPIILGVQ